MSEEQAESTPQAPTGSIEEATNRLAAMRTPEPTQEAAPEPETEKAEVESTEDVTASETQLEATDEVETQEVEQEQPEDTTEGIELDADQFASLLQLDNDKLFVDDDNQVKFKTKVDGEQGEATLEQLLKSYQTEASNNNKSMKLADMKKAQQELFDQSNNHAQQQAQFAATMLEAIKTNYLNEVSQANLDQLRIDDPAEYSARQIEFSQKQQQIQDMANQSLQALNEANQAQEAEKQRLTQERIPIEVKAFEEAFKNMNVKITETLPSDITTYLKSQNYSDDEIKDNPDHRFMVMAYKAKMFDQGTKNVTEKQVKKKLPKVLKSGQKPSVKAVNSVKLNKAIAKAKKSGSVQDAVARLKASRQT